MDVCRIVTVQLYVRMYVCIGKTTNKIDLEKNNFVRALSSKDFLFLQMSQQEKNL